MKRVLVTAVAAGFLSVFVLGCGDKGASTTKATGSTETMGTGKGGMSSGSTETKMESTRK